MAISTFGVFFMKKGSSGGTYEKLIDIKSFPDLGGAPEMLDTTTLSNKMKTSIAGILSGDSMEFTANYTKEDYTKLKALEGQELDLAVWFGATESSGTITPSGSDGKFNFKGSISVFVPGKGVNEVVEMTITVARSTDITVAEE